MVSTVINSVISLFLIMLVGIYASKKKIVTPDINKGLTNLLVNITLPALILSSFMTKFDEQMKGNVYQAFYYSLISFVIIFFISYIFVLPIKGPKKDIINFSNIFPNTGFLGFPILNVVYGSEGVVYGAAYSMFFNFFVFSYGMMLFRGFGRDNNLKKELSNVLKHPAIIAVFIGIIIMLFSLEIPEIVYSSLKLVGNITGPLSMIVVGVTLSSVNLKNYFKDWTIYYGTVIKLIIMPLILTYIYKLIDAQSIVTNTIILQTAMPTATLASIFAEQYNKKMDYATIVVVMTTLFSILTIPLIIKVLS